MDRFSVYTRVSGAKGSKQDENFSRGSQQELGRMYGERQGWTLEGFYHDSQTGTDYEDRKEVQAVLQKVKLGLVRHVVFAVIDRIGRDMAVIERFITDIYNMGGKVSVASSGATYDDAETCIEDNFFEIAVADYERRKIKRRTTDGRINAFKLGSYAKRPPYGYVTKKTIRHVGGMNVKFTDLEISELDAVTIRLILEHYAITRSKISAVKYANEHNLYHNGKLGNWHYSTLCDVISNAEIYAGILQTMTLFDEDKKRRKPLQVKENPTIEYTYPAIISRELAERVMVASRLNDGKSYGTTRPKPLIKLVYCSCGRRARYETHTTLALSRYVCPTNSKNRRDKFEGRLNTGRLVCGHYISPIHFIRKLKAYLDTLDSDAYVTAFELELAQLIKDTKYSHDELERIEIERETVKASKDDIAKRFMLLPIEQLQALSGVLEEESKRLQEDLDGLAVIYAEKQKEFTSKNRILQGIGINFIDFPMTEDPYLIPATEKMLEAVVNIKHAQRHGLDATAFKPDAMDALALTAQSQGVYQQQTKEAFEHLLKPQLEKVRESISELRAALEGEDWGRVSYLMAFLGMRFEATFSEPDTRTRRASIRLLVDYREGETPSAFADVVRDANPLEGGITDTLGSRRGSWS